MKAVGRVLLTQFPVHLQHSGITCTSTKIYWFKILPTWNRDGKNYAGEYRWNEETGEVKGCPAHASNVKAVVHSVKPCQKSKGASATRNHAEAMTLEELQWLMEWSTQECPNEWLTDNRWQESVAALKHRLQHGFSGALSYSAFRPTILQRVVLAQPLSTFLTSKLSSWNERDGRTRRAMMV